MTEILVCDDCGEEYEYDPQNRGGDRRTTCATCRARKKRESRYGKVVKHAGGECQRCGYDGCYAALDFHHEKPEEKEFAINSRTVRRAWEDVIEEVDKCTLLCANCHREIECTREDCDSH
jgi:hypothetical protein